MHFDRTNGLPSDWVISLWEDREKNLWCGTGAGLVVIRPNNLETISPPDKWKSRPVLSVLPAPDGALWVGTEGAGLYRLQNGDWTNFDSAQGIRNPYVWSLAADGAGKIWAGTWGGGLFAQKDDAFDFAPGLENFLPPMPALLFVGDELWIGTPAGALRYQNGKLERFSEIAGEPFGDVRAIAQDKSGALWFGTAGGGLVRRQNGNFRRFKKSDGLSSDFIECLHFADDGALWIGTFGGGLDRFKDGKFSVINREQGLPNGVIGHIEADGRGFFWMSSYGGILRASEKDLNRCADGEIAEVPFLTYGINEGLPTLECSEGLQSAGGKTADGRLWFPTAKGLVAVDPAGVKLNPLPPPVRIEEMRVDDKKFADGNAAGPLKIPPGRHRIEFEYTGLSFVAPEKVRFKCRLNNLETEWADVGAKRVATYNYIPPGNYSFQVTACNNDGVWNETGASLAFEVLPYFWQTTWFHVLGGLATVLAASGAVWFDTRRRMRRRLERAERQRDIERERSRIAQDIHDDLGAQPDAHHDDERIGPERIGSTGTAPRPVWIRFMNGARVDAGDGRNCLGGESAARHAWKDWRVIWRNLRRICWRPPASAAAWTCPCNFPPGGLQPKCGTICSWRSRKRCTTWSNIPAPRKRPSALRRASTPSNWLLKTMAGGLNPIFPVSICRIIRHVFPREMVWKTWRAVWQKSTDSARFNQRPGKGPKLSSLCRSRCL